jgi:hypothetical protein
MVKGFLMSAAPREFCADAGAATCVGSAEPGATGASDFPRNQPFCEQPAAQTSAARAHAAHACCLADPKRKFIF